MKSQSGRVIVACCTLSAVTGLLIYAFIGMGAGAAAQKIPDMGRFKLGSILGEERLGFSGRPMVMVFTRAGDPDWPELSACLASAEVTAQMDPFVGVIVNTEAEPLVEVGFRVKDNLHVIVRDITGEFLGGLPGDYACQDVVSLLISIRAGLREREKSPIYASLLESSQAVTALKTTDDGAVKAARFVELLREFEGATSESVRAAEAALSR